MTEGVLGWDGVFFRDFAACSGVYGGGCTLQMRRSDWGKYGRAVCEIDVMCFVISILCTHDGG